MNFTVLKASIFYLAKDVNIFQSSDIYSIISIAEKIFRCKILFLFSILSIKNAIYFFIYYFFDFRFNRYRQTASFRMNLFCSLLLQTEKTVYGPKSAMPFVKKIILVKSNMQDVIFHLESTDSFFVMF